MRAETMDEALAAGGRYTTRDTNLIDLMKLQVETPAKLVDIS